MENSGKKKKSDDSQAHGRKSGSRGTPSQAEGERDTVEQDLEIQEKKKSAA